MISKTTENIKVDVRVRYVPEQSQPDRERFFFAYQVTLTNMRDESAQLLSRHWIITNGRGQTEEVRGAGVIGEQPVLEPGASFEYTSFCPLTTATGTMRGFYHWAGADGAPFSVEIPEFDLIQPEAMGLLH